MIGKIPKPGKSFKGCLEYNLLKQDATVLYADGVRTDQVAHTIADFNRQREMNPALGQAVGHIALSWSAEDEKKLSDEVMLGVAREYLQQMKIGNTQLLIVRHLDKSHPHIHIVYNRVDNDGKTISDAFQYRNNVRICKALTLQHGFYLAPGKERVNRNQLKGADKIKYELHDAIKAASKKVRSMDDLALLLKQQGISMIYKYRSGTREVQGISFAKGNYTFKGSEIDRSLSYGRLSKQLHDQAEVPSLATQLRQAIGEQQPQKQYIPIIFQTESQPLKHTPSVVGDLLSDLLQPLQITPEPEPLRKRKKKKNEHEQERGLRR